MKPKGTPASIALLPSQRTTERMTTSLSLTIAGALPFLRVVHAMTKDRSRSTAGQRRSATFRVPDAPDLNPRIFLPRLRQWAVERISWQQQPERVGTPLAGDLCGGTLIVQGGHYVTITTIHQGLRIRRVSTRSKGVWSCLAACAARND